MSFHRDISKNGRWHAGDVVRCFDGAFGDAVILGFDPGDSALVERPYAYASSVGTTGPSVLLGSERIVYQPDFIDRFTKVGDKRIT